MRPEACPDEITLHLYTEGELEPGERRPLETHLVGCRECRGRVLALREEARLLRRALREEDPAPAARPVAEVSDPGGLAIGVPAALALSVLSLAVGGALLETRLPSTVGWLVPLVLSGAYDMVFDLVFLLRDRAPGLFDLALAVAATASVSTLASLGVAALVRRWSPPSGLVLLALGLWLLPVAAGAFDSRFDSERVQVAPDEVVPQSLVATGDLIEVDGRVEGDLVVFAERLVVRGTVQGNVFAIARQVEIRGRVEGGVHAAGREIGIEGRVAGSVYSLAQSLSLAAGAFVGRDAAHAGEHARVDGAVGRDFSFAGDWVEVGGPVGRNVQMIGDRMRLLAGARVGGGVEAVLPEGEAVERDAGSEVAGEIRVASHEEFDDSIWDRYREPHWYLWLAVRTAAAFVAGLALRLLLPGLFSVRMEGGREFFRALGTGLVTLLAGPLVLAIVAITLVGAPLALLGLFAYLAALYVAGIVVAAWVGRRLAPPEDERLRSFAVSLLAGLLVLLGALLIPFVGEAVRVVSILVGLGLLVERVRQGFATARGV